jgi:hypothetical protein
MDYIYSWCNADQDMLVCSSCDAALAVPLNSLLPATAIQTITDSYRTKIATNHLQECPFRIDAEICLTKIERNLENEKTGVPGYMASVLAPESLKLLENSDPTKTLQAVIARMDGGLSERKSVPTIEIPSVISKFDCNGRRGDQLIASLAQKMNSDPTSTLTLLSVLGWTRIDAADLPKDEAKLSLGCPCCLAWMDLPLTDDAGSSTSNKDSENSRVAKRSRQDPINIDPLKAHRHYCPFLVGFPSSATKIEKPGWQRILERSVEGESVTQTTLTIDEDEDATFYRLRKILRSGISKKRPSYD